MWTRGAAATVAAACTAVVLIIAAASLSGSADRTSAFRHMVGILNSANAPYNIASGTALNWHRNESLTSDIDIDIERPWVVEHGRFLRNTLHRGGWKLVRTFGSPSAVGYEEAWFKYGVRVDLFSVDQVPLVPPRHLYSWLTAAQNVTIPRCELDNLHVMLRWIRRVLSDTVPWWLTAGHTPAVRGAVAGSRAQVWHQSDPREQRGSPCECHDVDAKPDGERSRFPLLHHPPWPRAPHVVRGFC